jgi:hypothetical protein
MGWWTEEWVEVGIMEVEENTEGQKAKKHMK